MGNSALAYPDRTLTANSITGGNWTLPLSNLQDKIISNKARSNGKTTANTQFVVQVDASVPKDISVVSIIGHNFSSAATVQVKVFTGAVGSTLLFDSGTVNVWPVGFTSEDIAVWPRNMIILLPYTVTGLCVQVLIDDSTSTNTDGYVELGRCWVSPMFKPDIGITQGAEIGYTSFSTVKRSMGGTPWADIKTPLRSCVITFPQLDEVEKRTAMLFQKTISNVGEVLFIPDVTYSTIDMIMYSFPALVSSLSRIRMAAYQVNELPLELTENV